MLIRMSLGKLNIEIEKKFPLLSWEDFPTNEGDYTVKDALRWDCKHSDEFTIVTGLDHDIFIANTQGIVKLE